MSDFKDGDRVEVIASYSIYYQKLGEVVAGGRFGLVRVKLEDEPRVMSFDPSKLELVKENKVSKFNAGDKVRVISGASYQIPVGSEGVVTVIGADWPTRVLFPFTDRDWGFHDHNIELVEEKEVTEFKVGDKVSVTGTVTEVSKPNEHNCADRIAVTVDFDNNGDTSTDYEAVACVWSAQVTLVERPEVPVAIGTIVEDSHGCQFVLGRRDGKDIWVRFWGEEGEANANYGVDSYAGKALSKIARKSQ